MTGMQTTTLRRRPLVNAATYAVMTIFVLGWVWLLFHLSIWAALAYAKWWGWLA